MLRGRYKKNLQRRESKVLTNINKNRKTTKIGKIFTQRRNLSNP